MAHGTWDNVVPLALGERSRDAPARPRLRRRVAHVPDPAQRLRRGDRRPARLAAARAARRVAERLTSAALRPLRLVPVAVHLLEASSRRACGRSRRSRALDVAEAAAELAVRGLERALRVDAGEPRHVHGRRTAGRRPPRRSGRGRPGGDRLAQLRRLLVELRRARPAASFQSKPTRETLVVSWNASITAGRPLWTLSSIDSSCLPFCLALRGLDRLPVAQHLARGARLVLAEHVRVAAHHLLGHALDHLRQREGARAPRRCWRGRPPAAAGRPSSPASSSSSFSSIACATSYASSIVIGLTDSCVCSRSQGQPPGARRRAISSTKRANRRPASTACGGGRDLAHPGIVAAASARPRTYSATGP